MSTDNVGPVDDELDPTWLSAFHENLATIQAGRGYLLSSHAMLAVEDAELMQRYEEVYRIITYSFKSLTSFEKNFVWLVVIGCAQTPTGAHHLTDFIKAGGSVAQAQGAHQLAMLAIGAAVLDRGTDRSVAKSWQVTLPSFSAETAYRDAVVDCVAGLGLAESLVNLGLAAGQACLSAWDKVAMHLRAAKQTGASDASLAEALSVVILPAGNPAFVQASAIWRDLIRQGEIEASAPYRYAASYGHEG